MGGAKNVSRVRLWTLRAVVTLFIYFAISFGSNYRKRRAPAGAEEEQGERASEPPSKRKKAKVDFKWAAAGGGAPSQTHERTFESAKKGGVEQQTCNEIPLVLVSSARAAEHDLEKQQETLAPLAPSVKKKGKCARK